MKTHLLIVDDEAFIREVVSHFFRSRRYTVSTAGNWTEAMEMMAREAIDLVLLDVELGSEDGLELLSALKREHPGTPVVIITGRGYEENLWQRARRNGADGYISKMLPLDQVLMEVKRLLNHFQTRGTSPALQESRTSPSPSPRG